MQDAVGDAHVGHIAAGGRAIAGPVGDGGQGHFTGPVLQNGAGGGLGAVIGPLVDDDGYGHAGSIVVVVVPGFDGGDSDGTRLGGGQGASFDSGYVGPFGNGEGYRTVTGAADATYPLTVRAALYQDGNILSNSTDEVTLTTAGESIVIGGDALIIVKQGATSQVYLRNENANSTWTNAQLSIVRLT